MESDPIITVLRRDDGAEIAYVRQSRLTDEMLARWEAEHGKGNVIGLDENGLECW